MQIIDKFRHWFNKNARPIGMISASIGIIGVFGWDMFCGILCVIFLNDFITR